MSESKKSGVSEKAWTTIGVSANGDVRLVLEVRGAPRVTKKERAQLEEQLAGAMTDYLEHELQDLEIVRAEFSLVR